MSIPIYPSRLAFVRTGRVDVHHTLPVVTVSAVVTAITIIFHVPIAAVPEASPGVSQSAHHHGGSPLAEVFIPMIGAARAVAAVTTRVPIVVSVAIPTIVLARGVISATRRRRPAPPWRAARRTLAVATRVEPPRCRRRGASPLERCRSAEQNKQQSSARARSHLDLQDVVTTNTLVVHVVIGIVGIATVLILNKCKPVTASSATKEQSTTSGGRAYRRLLAERGAGMSQRTRRP